METFRKWFRVSLNGLQINVDDDAFTALEKRVVIVTESVNTGDKFTEAVRHLIGAHKPDLVWIDPLLSFIGDDISRQDVCSYFFRNLLNPISFESGICWMLMHHTNKPSADPNSKSGWNAIDYSYSGTGSSELTNWARAVCFLRSTKDEGRFELALNKRGPRAKATHLEGDRTTVIHLKHSDDSILWEQIPKPVLVVKTPKEKKKRPEKTIGDMDGLIEKIIVPMKKSQVVRFAVDGGHGSYYVANKDWKKIEKRLFKNENGLFLNYDPNDQNQLSAQIKKQK